DNTDAALINGLKYFFINFSPSALFNCKQHFTHVNVALHVNDTINRKNSQLLNLHYLIFIYFEF
ncbi:hypothetical protein, partial [Bacillus sp. PF5]|uniref:hypothetical protein n=1 Tax=Bacillus sp. PF5 TaxID=2249214 RepID=UPI0019631BB2